MAPPRDASMLAHALYWAARGFSVFPVRPELTDGRKVPQISGWGELATTNPDQIMRWWSDWPDANVGAVPDKSGCYVVDLDVKSGKDGLLELRMLAGPGGVPFPDTLTIRTGSGGQHRWLRGRAPNSASKIAPGIDIRGARETPTGLKLGFVVLPPSRFGEGDAYEVIADLPLSECDWFADLARRQAYGNVARLPAAGLKPDLPCNVARAEQHLRDLARRGDVAVEGKGGDARTYALFCQLHDLGLSESKAVELSEHWNSYCDPPWDQEALEQKACNAFSYAENPWGCQAVRPSAEVFGVAVQALAAPSGRFRPLSPADMRALPEPRYVVEGLIPDEAVTLLAGPPAQFKSFILLDLLVSTAAGGKAFGQYQASQGGVVLCAGEGARGTARKRFPAVAQAHGIDAPDELPFYLVRAVPKAARPEEFDELIAEIRAACPGARIIAIDTVARAMRGLNDNAAEDASRLMDQAERLRDEFHCAVILIHHTNKGGEDPRGSSVFEGDPDAGFTVKRKGDGLFASMVCWKMKDDDEPSAVSLVGTPVGGSLAFRTATPEEAAEGSHDGDSRLTPAQIGRALKELGAVEDTGGEAVTTRVLAVKIAGTGTDNKLIGSVTKALNRGASRQLAAYVSFNGTRGVSRMWWLPHAERPAQDK